MPQNRRIVATMSSNRSIYIYNMNHDREVEPITLTGHDNEGYGMAWNPSRANWLATCAYDAKVMLWDIT